MMKKKERKNKILALVAITLLLSAPILYAQPQSGWQTITGGLGKYGAWIREKWGRITTLTLIYWLTRVTKSAADNFHSHLRDYVLVNPDPKHPHMLKVMNFFIQLALTFYVFAITLTGFYLIFVSGSPRGRAKAKYTLGKLILGMAFVSISPLLLQLLFQFSYSLTDAILDQGDIGIVTAEFNTALWRGYWGTLVMIVPDALSFVYGGFTKVFYRDWTKLVKRIGLDNAKKLPWVRYRGVRPPPGMKLPPGTLLERNFPKIKEMLRGVGITGIGDIIMYPYFLIIVLLVLTFGLLAFRYLMLMIWTILFPLAIFFTSFEMTKNIGRIMVEQLLQWTLFQVFYALILVAMSIGLMILPEAYTGYSILWVAFHSVAVVFVLFFYPWYLSSILQKLFPP